LTTDAAIGCPTCQIDKAATWLEKQTSRLLPVHHFLVTFNVPQEARMTLRARFPRDGVALRRLLRDGRPDSIISGRMMGSDGRGEPSSATCFYHLDLCDNGLAINRMIPPNPTFADVLSGGGNPTIPSKNTLVGSGSWRPMAVPLTVQLAG